MTFFAQIVQDAQREIQDAIQAGSRPSMFSQGVMPTPPTAPPQAPMLPPQMPMMPMQQAPMLPPQVPVQQFAEGGLAVWDRPAPKGTKTKPLTPKLKAKAKRRAKAAGRPYPNAVDNFAVRR